MSNNEDKIEGQPYRVTLPGFLKTEEDIGLGDVIKRITTKAGFKHCTACQQRAAKLNSWVSFSGRRPK